MTSGPAPVKADKKRLLEATRKLDAATGRIAINAAARKLQRVPAQAAPGQGGAVQWCGNLHPRTYNS